MWNGDTAPADIPPRRGFPSTSRPVGIVLSHQSLMNPVPQVMIQNAQRLIVAGIFRSRHSCSKMDSPARAAAKSSSSLVRGITKAVGFSFTILDISVLQIGRTLLLTIRTRQLGFLGSYSLLRSELPAPVHWFHCFP